MDDMVMWAMFYSSVVSMQYHPGTKEMLTLRECAEVADRMYDQLLLREKFYGVDRSRDRGSG